MNPQQLENEIAKRFGVLPNFFRLASCDPKIAANLWGFAQFAYLDNPLPSLFKERLFVYLSRFCEIRYCIARHVGFLVGLGHPAGDPSCPPATVESILPLLRRPLPSGDGLLPLIEHCAGLESPLSSFPAPDSLAEQALFACATHAFLQTPDAATALDALRGALGPFSMEQMNLLLAFVRTAHYWTKLHPELSFEDDVAQLLTAHEALANCVLRDPDAPKDGLSRQVAAELLLRLARKRHEGMTQAFQDLSVDHQYVKQSLHETEQNLHELISVMPAAVYACDSDGIITYYNRQAEEIWGRAPEIDAPPWSFLDSRRIYRPDGTLLRPEEAPVREALATGVPIVNSELILELPNLRRINVLANITALRDSRGVVTGAVAIFQDVTELKNIQQEREVLLAELERSNCELSQFSYSVAHDLQAPVRHVNALAGLLAEDNRGAVEDRSHILTMLRQAATGMDRLISSLLGYAQAGQGQLTRQMVVADSIIESVCLTLAPLIAKTGAQILHEPLPPVDADPVLLGELFQNLIANAINYHRPGEAPVVEISGIRLGAEWLFTVKDNGEGIDTKYQHEIFEPLKRLHGSETPGTGLGLALCRTIVARHGGRIWVESQGAGYGAIFRFTLSATGVSPSITERTTVGEPDSPKALA